MVNLVFYPDTHLQNPNQSEDIINQIFKITYMTMTAIIPSANKKDEDYRIWRESHIERLNNGDKFILLYGSKMLKGYLSYRIREDSADIFICDVIIHSDYQGDGKTFLRLLCHFLNECKNNKFNTIRTYANNLNRRSQSIIEKVGFIIDEQKHNGKIYCIDKNYLLKKFSKYIDEEITKEETV